MVKINYKKSGVNYDLLDPFKVLAQKAAKTTDTFAKDLGIKSVKSSRGESCFLMEYKDGYLAHVEEGLGTKNLIADAMGKYGDKTYYNNIAIDTVATIVNDLITLGALPVSIAMHLAVGNSEWFRNHKRMEDLVKGWKLGCKLSGCVWAGGETPTLKGIIEKESALLGGSAVGIVKDKSQLISGDIQSGDRIILMESSGIHANGASLARRIAKELPLGFKTKMDDGKTFGDGLLAPSIIYVPVIKKCFDAGIKIHYAVHITGHGWRKLMRATSPFVYVIEKILKPLPVFKFIQQHSGMDEKEMYATFNMGAGFALYVDKKDAKRVLAISKECKMNAIDAGYIKKQGKTKKVKILPKKIEYSGSSLAVR
ncbi:MAG: AIR synthase-related protein [Candidatus Gracilibacteria bacterium]|jgi:phosphoribosylformylglycinamidine cyclo-ligase